MTRERAVSRLCVFVTAVMTAIAIAVPASANPVAGATYVGTAADGASITLTVSPDGTLVTAYRIINVKTSTGCQFTGEGDLAVWEGAPVSNDTFGYQLGEAIVLHGTFSGAQTATGTFSFYNPAIGRAPTCATGTVNWTATTREGGSTAGANGGGSTGGSGTSGSGAGGKGPIKKHQIVTRVALRKASPKRLAVRLSSPNTRCRGSRTLYLWRKSKRVARGKTNAKGTYSFAHASLWRGRSVRVSVTSRALPKSADVCAAASSVFIHA
jgi:hypothetical protein